MATGTKPRRDYGEGSIYQRRSDWRWIATIEAGWTRDGNRKRTTVSGPGCYEGCPPRCAHRTKIKRKLADKRRDIEDGGSTDAKAGTTVKTWAEEWLKIHVNNVRPKPYATDASTISRWVIPTIGHRRLDALTPHDIRTYLDAMRKGGLKASTLGRYHGTLMTMLNAAILEGHRVPNRVLMVPKPEANESDRDKMTPEQVMAVLRVIADLPHGSRWLFQMLYGCRQQEANGLTWDAIDFDANTVTIEWQLQPLPYIDPKKKSLGFRVPDGYEHRRLHASYHLVRPKTAKGVRVVPLPSLMREALLSWREVAFPNEYGLVWPTRSGKASYPQYDREEWHAIQCTAGVGHEKADPPRWFHTHEARHGLASILIELGADPQLIKEIMGWSKIVEGYIHIGDDRKRELMEQVAQRLELPTAG